MAAYAERGTEQHIRITRARRPSQGLPGDPARPGWHAYSEM